MNTAAARAERIPPAAVAADPARLGSAVLLATARAADGGAAALLPWGETTLLGRLLGQLAGLGIASTHVIARPDDADKVAAAVAGHAAVVHASTGPAADLDVVAAIAAEAGGGLVVAAGDLVTQDEALAGLIADTRLPTGVLASISRTGYPFTQRMRLRGGRVISAASPYHTVRAPNAVFLDVLKVAGADRAALAAAAAQLHGLLRDGVPGEWEESFEGKIERWRGALARRARGLEPPDDPPPGEDAAPVELDDAAVLAGHEDEEPGDVAHPVPAHLRPEDEAQLAVRTASLRDDTLALLVCGLVRSGVPVHPRRLRGLAWVRPRTETQLATATARVAARDEDAARRRYAVKGNDGFFTTHFVSPYSQYIARWAARRGWTPDAVTLLSLAVGIVAAAAFATGERAGMIAGALLLQAAFTLDCVDGQLARYTRRFSRFGAWLDAIGDRSKEYLAFAGLALGAAQGGDDVWLLAGAALALQTVRHSGDFCFGDAQRQVAPAPVFPPLEQSRDVVVPAGRVVAPAPVVPAPPTLARRVRGRLRAIDRSRRFVWIKKLIAFPIGERFAVISITAALFTPRVTFIALLAWGAVALGYTNLGRLLRAYGRRGKPTAPTVPTDRNVPRRDDGPLARALGRLLGARIALSPAALVALGLTGLLAGIAVTGAGAGWPVVAAAVAWLVLCAGMSSERPLHGRLDWSVPPLLRAGEYAGLLWIGAVAGAVPAAFALLCAITYHHYDVVYRWRQLGTLPSRRLGDAAGGWDGRPRRHRARRRRRAAGGILRRRRDPGRRLRGRQRAGLGGVPHHPRPDGVRGIRGGGRLIGMVLAAGAGRRLQPYTDTLPKTLVPVDGERTILDIALANLKAAGLGDVAVVTGYAAGAVEDRKAALERDHGVRLQLVFNPRAEEWNNAYSLWCARELLAAGVLLVNGDTVHPPAVEEKLLAARGPDIVLALDDAKALGAEEMKVQLSDDGWMTRINKALDPASSQGEYIGLTLIEPSAAAGLADALEATWRRDPQLYYEDGYQEFADRGGRIGVAPIGAVEWVEVDDHADLARAREVACRC